MSKKPDIDKDLWIYHGIDLVNRKMMINGPIDTKTTDTVCKGAHLMMHDGLDLPIHIYINSEGGNTLDANALYDTIRALPHEVHTYAMGYVASCAVDVYLAGDKRHIFPNAIMMMHTMSDTIDPDTKLHQLEDEVSIDQKIWDRGCEIYAERTGFKTKAWWKAWTKFRERYMLVQEAIDKGVVNGKIIY